MPTFTEVVNNLSAHPLESVLVLLLAIVAVRVSGVKKSVASKVAEVIHGDGNGQPSLTGIAAGMGTIIAGQADHERRLASVEAEQHRQGTEQLRQGQVLDQVQSHGCQQLAAHRAALQAGAE